MRYRHQRAYLIKELLTHSTSRLVQPVPDSMRGGLRLAQFVLCFAQFWGAQQSSKARARPLVACGRTLQDFHFVMQPCTRALI